MIEINRNHKPSESLVGMKGELSEAEEEDHDDG